MTPRDGRLGIGAASEDSLPGYVGGDLDAPPDATNEAGEAHKAVAAGFAKSERDNIDDDHTTTRFVRCNLPISGFRGCMRHNLK
jgi:hypothetical protein